MAVIRTRTVPVAAAASAHTQASSNVLHLVQLAASRPAEAALQKSLTQLVKRSVPKGHAAESFEPIAPGAAHEAPTAMLASSKAAAANDNFKRTMRSLATYANAPAQSAAATTTLSHQALRHWLTSMGWQMVADQLAASPQKKPLMAPLAGMLHTLKASETGPVSLMHIARSIEEGVAARTAGGDSKPLTTAALAPHEARALVDAFTSIDPGYSTAVRERVAAGLPAAKAGGSTWERKLPIAEVLAEKPRPAESAGAAKGTMGGLVFDLGTNTWVQRDRSWTYGVRLRNVLEYVVSHKGKAIIDGPGDVARRLYNMSRDPLSNRSSLELGAIESFLNDLAEVAKAPAAPATAALLDHPFEMTFSTANGGDVPVGASWELPDVLSGRILSALDDPKLVKAVGEQASTFRAAREASRARRLAPLAEVLARYPGQAIRHKRAHGALINVNEKLGMGFAEVSAEGGPIPKSSLYVTPEDVRTRFADAQNLKVRYLFNRDFELGVISDEGFKHIQNTLGFPPNHEFLALGSEIPGSGYLTFHQGKIVNVHDDIVVEPGKLPDRLPPALEVLRALKFPIDEEKIQSSRHLLNFELFKKESERLKSGQAASTAYAGPASNDVQALKKYFESLPPPRAAGEIASWLRSQVIALKTATGGEKEKTLARTVSAVLAQFEIGAVGMSDFRKGDLPKHLNDYSDLTLNDELSSSLIRLAGA